ncbi:MAG: hypothetical protein QOD99_1976 [Chthoniobacter sp.]|jgi:hypothetical protein|nr:hypothetical protein [Chthoniobacter sp.]
MDWIKKNYDQAALLLVSFVLLAMSVWLFLNAAHFSETFESLRGDVVHNDKVSIADLSGLEQAKAALAKPAGWSPKAGTGSLFASEKYILKDGQLISPLQKGQQALHPPVPNEWFDQNHLDILSDGALADDPDGDKFSNLEEFNGKTDPQDKNSHPAYVTKLRLVKAIQQPFRLLFQAYDGDPAKPDSLNFQLNTVDVKQPTLFLKLGDPIPKTKFKILSFAIKKEVNKKTESEEDVSELTVQNTETNDKVVLVLAKMANSPDSYALFKYLWDGSQFPVKKDKTFSLKPTEEIVYKLVDIKDTEALIENAKTGEKITVPKLEQP